MLRLIIAAFFVSPLNFAINSLVLRAARVSLTIHSALRSLLVYRGTVNRSLSRIVQNESFGRPSLSKLTLLNFREQGKLACIHGLRSRPIIFEGGRHVRNNF